MKSHGHFVDSMTPCILRTEQPHKRSQILYGKPPMHVRCQNACQMSKCRFEILTQNAAIFSRKKLGKGKMHLFPI